MSLSRETSSGNSLGIRNMAEPFPYTNLVELLQFWGCHEEHRPAFIFVDKTQRRLELSRQQLYQLGGRFAAVLKEGGVGRKDLVVSTLPNGPERALCDVGIVLAGAVTVNAQCLLADGSDLLHVLRQSKASAVCVNPDLEFGPWKILKQHTQHDPETNAVKSLTLPHLRKVFFIRRTTPLGEDGTEEEHANTEKVERTVMDAGKGTSLKDGFSCPETDDFIASLKSMGNFYQADVAADETVIVFTTSGSTGFSKLVPHTHTAMLTVYQFLRKGSLDQFSLIFSPSPLGWLGGYVFMYLALGKGRVLLDMWHGAPEDLAAFMWDTIVQEGCEHGVIMPFLLPKILVLEKKRSWKMKSLMVGGQPVKKLMIQQALQLSESALVALVSSELLMVTAVLVTDASDYQDHLAGKALPGNTVKICDSDGKEVRRGTKGEIYAKNQIMTKAYLNDEENTAAAFTPDGFLKTGDIGVMLEDGSLLVEGRNRDAIHRGNYIFYPTWLESRIMTCCPGLEDVFVVGVPDSAMGEEMCACFVPSDPSVTEEYVRRRVEEDIVSSVEDPMSPRPRYYLSFQQFPKTFTDKPLRRNVRREAIQKLNLA